MFDFWESLKEVFNDRKDRYSRYEDAKSWLEENIDRVRALFSNYRLRDFVFEPFLNVIQTPYKSIDANIYSVITQVAIVNAVLAGLPGKMGIGVFVSMGFEGWMAYRIAQHVGVRIESTPDIWKYFGLLAGILGTIFFLFRHLLGFGFSLFSTVLPGGINPLIPAEIFVTNFFGVLFWLGFLEVRQGKPFSIPKRMYLTVLSRTKGIAKHQWGMLKNILSPTSIKLTRYRLLAYLKGDFPVDMRLVNGELFSTAAMAYLIAGKYEELEGPLGQTFLQAIRLRWSDQFDENTPVHEIAARFRDYDAEELHGALNTIKGKMFEILVVEQENLDGDDWVARMHTDESFPGSDVIFTNAETGQQVEVSLKAASADNTSIIEDALARYPDLPIMTTDEAAEIFDGHDMVFGSGILEEDLTDVTEERLDELIARIKPVDANEVVIAGVTVGAAAALWPFVMAFLKGDLTKEQLQRVFEHVLGEVGIKLASRVVYGAAFGALFAWFLLARGVQGLVVMAEPEKKVYVEYVSR